MRWIEIAKRWQKKGIKIHVMTTEAGAESLNRLGYGFEIHTIPVPFIRSGDPLFERVFNIASIPSELRRFDGIIYSPTTLVVDVLPGALIKKANPSSRFVVVEHFIASLLRKNSAPLNSILFSIAQKAGYTYAIRYADRFLAVSPNTFRAVSKVHGIGVSRVRCVSCGANQNPIPSLAVQAKEFDVLFLKRFHKTKGVLDALEAWKLVVSRFPDARLGIASVGSQQIVSDIMKFISENNLSKNVSMLGYVAEDQKAELFGKSRIFVHPSYEDNWSIVIGEAMAAGLPIVAYRLEEIQEVWDQGVRWVPKGDVGALADALMSLMSDEKKSTALGKAGQSFVKRYDWDRIAEEELCHVLDS